MLLAAAALLLRRVRPSRSGLPKQVKLKARKPRVQTSVAAFKSSLIKGELELKAVRSAAKHMLQMPGPLVRHEQKLS